MFLQGGFAMAWSEEEIQKYSPRDYAPLRTMYAVLGLDKKEPHRIAAYLMKNCFKLSSPEPYRALIHMVEKHGRAEALNFLEDIVIAEHRKHVAIASRMINPEIFRL